MTVIGTIGLKLGLLSDPQAVYPTIGPTESTEIISTVYSIEDFIREYKRTSLVRQCINLLAFYATRRGFRTVVLPISGKEENYISLKNKIDRINEKVNLDRATKIAIIKMKVCGCAAFEIVKDTAGEIVRLLPLRSQDLELIIDENWNLTNYKYSHGAKVIEYKPEDVLYFPNNALEADLVGLSDVEPIMTAIETKRALEHDLRACARQYWAPIQLYEMDTRSIRPDKVKKALKDFADSLKPGKSVIHNQSIVSKTVSLHPNIGDIVLAMSRTDEEIVGNFNIPKALVARERCFAADCKIIDAETGEVKTIKEFAKNPPKKLFTYNQETKQIEITDNFSIFESTPKKIVEVTTTGNIKLRVSYDHPILTDHGWVYAEDLTSDDWVFTPKELKIEKPKEVDKDLAWLTGFVLAEGSVRESWKTLTNRNKAYNMISINNNDQDLLDRVAEILTKLEIPFGRSLPTIFVNGKNVVELKTLIPTCSQKAKNKFIPKEVFLWDNSSKLAFIEGMVDGDGHINKYDIKTITTASKQMTEDLYLLFKTLGVNVSINKCSSDLGKWYNVSYSNNYYKRVPIKLSSISDAKKREYTSCGMKRVAEEGWGVGFYQVKSIEHQNVEPTYDLTVNPTHTAIVNGIVVSNTMNRATLEYSLRALYEGPIEGLQMDLKREIETQFYNRIIANEKLEGRVKIAHVWNPLTYEDFRDLAMVVATLFDKGVIDKDKAYEILHWREEIQAEKSQPEETSTEDEAA